MDMYDRTDPTWRSRGKAAWWTLFDVPTVATLGWGPALRAVAGVFFVKNFINLPPKTDILSPFLLQTLTRHKIQI